MVVVLVLVEVVVVLGLGLGLRVDVDVDVEVGKGIDGVTHICNTVAVNSSLLSLQGGNGYGYGSE